VLKYLRFAKYVILLSEKTVNPLKPWQYGYVTEVVVLVQVLVQVVAAVVQVMVMVQVILLPHQSILN
jgi:hypothetical protein